MDYMKIPAVMRGRRAHLNLTQEQVGDKIGESKAIISMWESGSRIPPLNQALKWANALGIRLGDLLNLVETPLSEVELLTVTTPITYEFNFNGKNGVPQ